jgi:hypothetical protein
MVRIKINNKDVVVREETTLLDAAREAGHSVPSLCHRDGLPHYTSCMVCMVRDNRSGNFVASCSLSVQEGMDIDVSSDEVISLRKKSVELLLSEHRAECEAPCRVVCPAGYNIPLFNRYLAAGDFASSVKLTLEEIGNASLACDKCPAYCENACRRKKIDIPVSIRNMKLFIYNSNIRGKADSEVAEADAEQLKVQKNKNNPKRFNSLIGKLEPGEQSEWLRECTAIPTRSREIQLESDAVMESGSCMHCDCRAANDCRLRDLANDFSLKDPRGKLINAPIVKKINYTTGLVFENAKCIKCGLCVRLCESTGEEPALCFINRGFISILSEPLTEEFDTILKTKSREVIEICPTGALSQFK